MSWWMVMLLEVNESVVISTESVVDPEVIEEVDPEVVEVKESEVVVVVVVVDKGPVVEEG